MFYPDFPPVNSNNAKALSAFIIYLHVRRFMFNLIHESHSNIHYSAHSDAIKGLIYA